MDQEGQRKFKQYFKITLKVLLTLIRIENENATPWLIIPNHP